MIKIKKTIFLSLNGFTLIELIVSIMIMTLGFLGIMTVYMDSMKNYAQNQFIEEAHFALFSQIEKISEDIKSADNIDISSGLGSGARIVIKPDVGEQFIYSCSDQKGFLKDGEQSAEFYGNTIKQLFENNKVYVLNVRCNTFDCDTFLPSMTDGQRLRDNFYTLIVEFEVTGNPEGPYPDFIREYKFEKEVFAKNMFATYDGNQ